MIAYSLVGSAVGSNHQGFFSIMEKKIIWVVIHGSKRDVFNFIIVLKGLVCCDLGSVGS